MKTLSAGVLTTMTLPLILLGVISWSCSSSYDERVGSGTEALEAGFTGTNSAISSMEVSAVWTPMTPSNSEAIVIGYNDFTFGTQGGWALSTNGGSTWNVCNASNPNDCNGAIGDAGVIPNAWGSDPVMVADKLGDVVYIKMDFATNGNQIIAAVSTDNGQTFAPDHALVVNDGHCSDGTQDQPAAAFDYTTSPPTLWIAYRHDGAPGGNAGACVRRGFIDPTTTKISWLGDSVDVGNLGSESGGSTGAILVQAGDGVVTVVYNNNTAANCPSTSMNSFAIESVSSFDNGATWESHARLFHSDSWLPCVLSGQVAMGATNRNFSFIRAPDGTYYVAAQYDQERVRLFKSRLAGVAMNGGSYQPSSWWSEFCPGTADADGGPTSNWTDVGVECPVSNWTFVNSNSPNDGGLASFSVAWPTMAIDDAGRLGLWYYEGDSTDQLFHVIFWSNPTPRSPTASFQSLILTSDFQPTNGNQPDGGSLPNFQQRILGDYEAMTVRGYGSPVCGAPGTFYPVWTMADGGGIDGAATPHEQVTQVTF